MLTIVVPISRRRYLDRFFESLNNLEVPPETNLFTYADGNGQIFQEARNLTMRSQFNERLCVYRRRGIPSDSDVKRRRQRISDIHNEIRNYIQDCEYIFLTEDDTILPTDAVRKLIETYTEGIISGVQMGRWGWDVIGGFEINTVINPKEISSVPMGEGVQKIDATGMYCCLTKKEVYTKHYFKPFEDVLGPDVDWGLSVRRQGLQNFINFDVKCLHMTPKKDIGFEKIEQIKFTKEKDWNVEKIS